MSFLLTLNGLVLQLFVLPHAFFSTPASIKHSVHMHLQDGLTPEELATKAGHADVANLISQTPSARGYGASKSKTGAFDYTPSPGQKNPMVHPHLAEAIRQQQGQQVRERDVF